MVGLFCGTSNYITNTTQRKTIFNKGGKQIQPDQWNDLESSFFFKFFGITWVKSLKKTQSRAHERRNLQSAGSSSRKLEKGAAPEARPAMGAGSADSWGAVVGGPAAAARLGCTLRAALGASAVTADVSLEVPVDEFSGNAARGTTGSRVVLAVVVSAAAAGGVVARGVSGAGVSGTEASGASPLGLAGRGARGASPLGLIGARVVVVVVVVSAGAAASLCSSLGLRAS